MDLILTRHAEKRVNDGRINQRLIDLAIRFGKKEKSKKGRTRHLFNINKNDSLVVVTKDRVLITAFVKTKKSQKIRSRKGLINALFGAK